MSRFLYIFSTIVLFFAVLLFLASGIKWLNKPVKRGTEESIIDSFHRFATAEAGRVKMSPLVERAKEFALILNLPASSEPTHSVQSPLIVTQPVNKTPVVSAKFRLLSTSCYLANPEKSLALVTEPGKGDRWIEKGERIGSFIVEKVEKGVIFYKDGNRLYKMNVTSVETPQMSRFAAAEKNDVSKPEIISETKSKSYFSPESLRHMQELSKIMEPAGYISRE